MNRKMYKLQQLAKLSNINSIFNFFFKMNEFLQVKAPEINPITKPLMVKQKNAPHAIFNFLRHTKKAKTPKTLLTNKSKI